MDIALFSPSSLFAADDDSSDGETTETGQSFVERNHQFPGTVISSLPISSPSNSNSRFSFIFSVEKSETLASDFIGLWIELHIREFGFHQLNANLLWPGTFAFADWLVQHRHLIQRRRCLEIGSGTGALAIFLHKEFGLDITTSDYDDQEIEDNIAHNCLANKIIPSLPHVKHTWGDEFPISEPDWDLIIASDILLYVKQYPNLIKTKRYLNITLFLPVTGLPLPVFLMSWRRRIGKDDESLFFNGCEDAGLEVKHLGNRVYCIKLRESSI
ncbi:unnamed protein product [Thlaspi arvense]|uniref:Uncharacterized protein n=1 Tax=Thlaspi arvense TaxID=13288 RepID=A0AAU9T0M6_THLAR|nr:unnamed protein product [Thlaspi arvense]